MLSRTMAGLVCLLLVISACAPIGKDLEIVTPQATLDIPTATATLTIPVPSATATLPPTPVPADAISPKNVDQVKLLHEYWLTVATAVGIDPYEMDISAVAASPDGQLLAVGGCSKLLEEDLRSGNLSCNGQDAESADGC